MNKADGVIIATPLFTAAYRRLQTFLDLLPQKAFGGKVLLPIVTEGATQTQWAIDYAITPQYSSVSDGEQTLKCRKPCSSVGLRTFIEKNLNRMP